MRRGGDYLSNKVAGLCGASLNYARKGGVNMSLFRLGNPLLVMGGTASADLFQVYVEPDSHPGISVMSVFRLGDSFASHGLDNRRSKDQSGVL